MSKVTDSDLVLNEGLIFIYLGLVVTRAYSLCHRNKLIIAALLFGFIGGFVVDLLGRQIILPLFDEESHSF